MGRRDGTKTESIVYSAVSKHLMVMKTDRLTEAWRAKQQLGQRAVVAAGLMKWLRKGILAGGYGCGQKGRGRRK